VEVTIRSAIRQVRLQKVLIQSSSETQIETREL
jgi:hypothetical protein